MLRPMKILLPKAQSKTKDFLCCENWTVPLESQHFLLLVGGSKSGKSALAEDWSQEAAERFSAPLIYLATMEAGNDPENLERIARHRRQRAGKGFRDVEKARDLLELESEIPLGAVILLECLGNLAANELFRENLQEATELSVEKLKLKILSDLDGLMQRCRLLILVSNDVSSDILDYDAGTKLWIRLMGALHAALAERKDGLCCEVTAGFPLLISPLQGIKEEV